MWFKSCDIKSKACDYRVSTLILFLGRVARAGRTGSAYSLVSSDELPYCIDLHLFISRPVILAKPDIDDDRLGHCHGSLIFLSSSEPCLYSIPGVYGSVPQSILDDEEDYRVHLHQRNSDLVYSWKIFNYCVYQVLRVFLLFLACSSPRGSKCSEAVCQVPSTALTGECGPG